MRGDAGEWEYGTRVGAQESINVEYEIARMLPEE